MSWLTEPWSSDIVRLAGAELILVGALAGALGVFVVLRGLAYAGEALAHTVLPGAAMAALIGGPIALGATVTAAGAAAIIGGSPRRRLGDDTIVGAVLVGALALGGLLLSQARDVGRSLESFLFGSVLGVTRADLALTLAVAALVAAFMTMAWRTLVAATFDPEAARAAGLPVRATDLGLTLALAAVVVIALQAVGSLLTLALIVTPAATARLVATRMSTSVAIAAAVGAGSGLGGLLASYWWGVASGGAVVLTASAAFLVALLAGPRGAIRGLRHRQAAHRP